jgi:hypothetical protein
LETLTNEMERGALEIYPQDRRVGRDGRRYRAFGYPQREIADAAYRYQVSRSIAKKRSSSA